MLRANKQIEIANDRIRYVWTDKRLTPHEHTLSLVIGKRRDLDLDLTTQCDLAYVIGLMVRSTNFTVFAMKFNAPNGCMVEIVECLTAGLFAVVCGPYIIESELTALDAAERAARMLLWEEEPSKWLHNPAN